MRGFESTGTLWTAPIGRSARPLLWAAETTAEWSKPTTPFFFLEEEEE